MPDPMYFVEAFAQSRAADLEAVLKTVPTQDALAKTLRAMIAFLQGNLRQNLDWKVLDPLLDAALQSPQQSRDLQVCLLNISYYRARNCQDLEEMERLHQRMTGCLPDLKTERAKGIVHRIGFFLADEHLHDPVLAQRAARLGLQDAQEGSDLWVEFQCKYAHACIGNHDFDGIETLLAKLEERQQDMLRCGDSWPLLRLRCDVFSGQPERALERIKVWQEEKSPPLIPFPVHVIALIACGQFEAAESLISAGERGDAPVIAGCDDLPLPQLAILLRMRLAMARRDLPTARAEERRLNLPKHFGQSIVIDPLIPSLHLALWMGLIDQAQTLLATLDPRHDRGDLLMEWTRLHLLQNDMSAAVTQFQKLVAKRSPRLIEDRLRFAYEVEARSVAYLYHASSEAIPPAEPKNHPMPASRIAPAVTQPSAALEPKTDIHGPPRIRERRQRLLSLFEKNQRLYREEIVQSLDCAPNTATADLAALEEAGLIRRVKTSGNLRTSYFVRTQTGE